MAQATQEAAAHAEAHHDHHPTPQDYVRIAIILAVLTALEVSLFYIDVGPMFLPAMITLMTVKFVMVVAEFMHLKYDTKLYRRVMATGLITAISVYGVALATFLSVRSDF